MKKCVRCGQHVQDTESYCPRCNGTAFEADRGGAGPKGPVAGPRPAQGGPTQARPPMQTPPQFRQGPQPGQAGPQRGPMPGPMSAGPQARPPMSGPQPQRGPMTGGPQVRPRSPIGGTMPQPQPQRGPMSGPQPAGPMPGGPQPAGMGMGQPQPQAQPQGQPQGQQDFGIEQDYMVQGFNDDNEGLEVTGKKGLFGKKNKQPKQTDRKSVV